MKYRKTIALAAVLLILGSIAALLYSHIAVRIFAASNGLDISYKDVKPSGLTGFTFKDLKVTWPEHGIGLRSGSASVKMAFEKAFPSCDLAMNNVSFFGKGKAERSSYDNIDGLLALPLSDLWSYETLSGRIGYIKDGIKVTDLTVSGDSLKFSFSGTLTNSNIISSDIVIYLPEALVRKIPPELSGMALKDEPDGWKSLSLKLEGDLAKPSIRVTGRMFRLNIGVKS